MRLLCAFFGVIMFCYIGCANQYKYIDTMLVNKPGTARKGVDARVFKVIADRKLELHIFYPKGYDAK